MPTNWVIDDNNTTLIQYQGAWTYEPGSTRQWDGGVHSTIQPGASATFKFRGYQLWVWGTIPAGVGTNIIDVVIDGGSPTTVTRTSNGSAVYNEPYFVSSLLRQTSHTIVVTYRGDPSKNSEFLLDSFQFDTDDDSPYFPPLDSPVSPSTTTSSSSTSSSSSSVSLNSSGLRTLSVSQTSSRASSLGTLSTLISTSFISFGASAPSTPYSSNQPTAASTTSSSPSNVPWAAIIGAVGGCCLLLLVVICLLIFKRRKKARRRFCQSDSSSLLNPTPFPLDNNARNPLQASSSNNRNPGNLHTNFVSEKGGYQDHRHQPISPRVSFNRLDSEAAPNSSISGHHPVSSQPSPHRTSHMSIEDDRPPSYWLDPIPTSST